VTEPFDTIAVCMCSGYHNNYYHGHYHCSHQQGCTNPSHQLTWKTKFSSVVPDICGVWMWNFLSCHLYGNYNFFMLSRFLENFWTPWPWLLLW